MSINLSNVNISLNEFQRLSQGTYNAGEVKLAGETKLAKMNNHVGSFVVNKDIISHEEVIAIKQALVKALSPTGVKEDALNKLRKELGISSADAADRDLRHRSIMPLTRQQIREILDRNAATINDFNTKNGGSVYISTLSQLHQAGPTAKSAQVRNAVNAKLVEHDRQVNVNEDILHFQSILSNSIDILGDAADGAADGTASLAGRLMRECLVLGFLLGDDIAVGVVGEDDCAAVGAEAVVAGQLYTTHGAGDAEAWHSVLGAGFVYVLHLAQRPEEEPYQPESPENDVDVLTLVDEGHVHEEVHDATPAEGEENAEQYVLDDIADDGVV